MSQNSKETILVTGGTGLVGHAIQDCAKDSCYENYEFIFAGTKDADLSDFQQTKILFEKYRPMYVIHLAAMVGGLFKNMRQNLEFFRINMAINDNVLKVSHDMKVKKCISILSTCIFPDKTTYPIDETMIHFGPPHDSNFGYAYAKRMVDVLNRAYKNHDQHNTEKTVEKSVFTSAIPTNIYGPFDNYNLEDSHVIPGLIHKAYTACENAKAKGLDTAKLLVCGSGKPVRQFIYSKDLAKLLIWTVLNYDEVEPIILSVDAEDETSIGETAKMVADSFATFYNMKCEIEYDTKFPDGQYKKTAANTKLRHHLPNFKFTPMKDGIDKSVAWFCENYNVARK